MVVGVFLFLIVLVALLILAGLSDRATDMLGLIEGTLVVPTGMIIVWYFTTGMVRDFKK